MIAKHSINLGELITGAGEESDKLEIVEKQLEDLSYLQVNGFLRFCNRVDARKYVPQVHSVSVRSGFLR